MILVVTCFAFLAHFAVAEHGVTFLYPVDGLTLNYLDTINVTWTSNFSSPQLFTFCTNKTDSSLMFGTFPSLLLLIIAWEANIDLLRTGRHRPSIQRF